MTRYIHSQAEVLVMVALVLAIIVILTVLAGCQAPLR